MKIHLNIIFKRKVNMSTEPFVFLYKTEGNNAQPVLNMSINLSST